MTRIQTTELDPAMQEALRLVADGERVVLEWNGRAVAALVPLEDAEVAEAAEDAADLEAYRAAVAEQGNAIPLEQYLRRRGE